MVIEVLIKSACRQNSSIFGTDVIFTFAGRSSLLGFLEEPSSLH